MRKTTFWDSLKKHLPKLLFLKKKQKKTDLLPFATKISKSISLEK